MALIAIDLFLNVFVPLLQPTVVNAQSTALMKFYMDSIQEGVQGMKSNIFRLVSVAEQICDVQFLYTEVRGSGRLCSDFIALRF